MLETRWGSNMIKKKRPWYIWFSFLAIVILWGDTTKRINANRNSLDDFYTTWFQAVWNLVSSMVGFVFLPFGILGFIADRIFYDYPNDSIQMEIVGTTAFIAFYFCGVYAAHRHAKWRKENIADLLK